MDVEGRRRLIQYKLETVNAEKSRTPRGTSSLGGSAEKLRYCLNLTDGAAERTPVRGASALATLAIDPAAGFASFHVTAAVITFRTSHFFHAPLFLCTKTTDKGRLS